MSDFQLFIDSNNISKKDIAEILGVSKAFVSQLALGQRKIPADKLKLILANENGWDISMFEKKSSRDVNVNGGTPGVIVNGDNSNSPISFDQRKYYSDSPDVLRAQIEILDERIKEKDAQIKEKDAQIKEKDAQIKQLLDILSKLR